MSKIVIIIYCKKIKLIQLQKEREMLNYIFWYEFIDPILTLLMIYYMTRRCGLIFFIRKFFQENPYLCILRQLIF